jgi:uncharacterized protein
MRESAHQRRKYIARSHVGSATVTGDDPRAAAAVAAIHAGDIEALERLLAEHAELATARIADERGNERTLLHVVTDWPGQFPAGARSVAALVAAGADVDAPGSVIDGGSPLADAVAFGQWRAARRLIEHGAHANLWQAAGLGLMDRVEHRLAAGPSPDEITNAFWCACHGGQREAAERLLEAGADINWVGHDDLTPLGAALRSDARELADWLRSRGAR